MLSSSLMKPCFLSIHCKNAALFFENHLVSCSSCCFRFVHVCSQRRLLTHVGCHCCRYLFRRILPTDDELVTVRRQCAVHIPKDLSSSERFFIAVSNSPVNLAKATDAFIFTLEFAEKVDEIARRLDSFRLACRELQGSGCLKALLGMALEVSTTLARPFFPRDLWCVCVCVYVCVW